MGRIALALLLCGCGAGDAIVLPGDMARPAAAVDMAATLDQSQPADLAWTDLAGGVDIATAPDMANAPDLANSPDFTMASDMAQVPADMAHAPLCIGSPCGGAYGPCPATLQCNSGGVGVCSLLPCSGAPGGNPCPALGMTCANGVCLAVGAESCNTCDRLCFGGGPACNGAGTCQ